MNQNLAGRFAVVLGAIGLMSLAAVALADEPLPAPKAAAEPTAAPDPIPPALDKSPITGLPRMRPKQDTTPESAAKNGKKTKNPLIAPPGLLSQAPVVPPYTSPGAGKLDLNRATLEQIQRLPGVGLDWAPRILAGRPYRSLGDLARDGIPFTTIDSLSREVELGQP